MNIGKKLVAIGLIVASLAGPIAAWAGDGQYMEKDSRDRGVSGPPDCMVTITTSWSCHGCMWGFGWLCYCDDALTGVREVTKPGKSHEVTIRVRVSGGHGEINGEAQYESITKTVCG
jgi:hypothetical protein